MVNKIFFNCVTDSSTYCNENLKKPSVKRYVINTPLDFDNVGVKYISLDRYIFG